MSPTQKWGKRSWCPVVNVLVLKCLGWPELEHGYCVYRVSSPARELTAASQILAEMQGCWVSVECCDSLLGPQWILAHLCTVFTGWSFSLPPLRLKTKAQMVFDIYKKNRSYVFCSAPNVFSLVFFPRTWRIRCHPHLCRRYLREETDRWGSSSSVSVSQKAHTLAWHCTTQQVPPLPRFQGSSAPAAQC